MPITALTIIYGDNANPPSTFTKINRDFNKGCGGEFVYLCYSTNPVHGSPITGIEVFAGGSGDFPAQSGYQRMPYDLNKGARGKFIYVYYTKNPKLASVVDICVLQSDSCYVYPPDDTWRRIGQDCSQGAGGKFTYIAYKQADVQMVSMTSVSHSFEYVRHK